MSAENIAKESKDNEKNAFAGNMTQERKQKT